MTITIATLTMNPAIDLSLEVARVVPEDKLRGGRLRYEPGGGGLNVSRALGHMEAESTAVYMRGGPTGDMLDDLLAEEGLERHPVEVADWTRQNFIARETDTGRQYRFGAPGHRVTGEECRALLDELDRIATDPKLLVVSGSLPPGAATDFYGRVVERFQGAGGRVVLDASGDAFRAALDHKPYLIKPNLRELRNLAGRDLEHEEDQEEAARELIESGRCEVVLLSLGAAGALLVHGGKMARLRSPSVTVRSKVGAGDSMVAGLVWALARQWPLEDAARRAVAAGAAAVMTSGTQLCRGEDVKRLDQRMKES